MGSALPWLVTLGAAVACAPEPGQDEALGQWRGAVVGAVEVRVASRPNDAEESNSGRMSLNSTDMELVNDGSRGAQLVGLRFTGIDVPQGATITEAHLEFTTDETNTGSTSLTLRAQHADHAPSFTSSKRNISTRTLTGAAVEWSPGPWSSVGVVHATPDLSAVVQEVVDRPGWVLGNAIAIVVTGTGERTAEAYDGVASSAALLHVEYDSEGAPPVCGDTVCNGSEGCLDCAVDCGACASCSDGVQNQGESGVDCGGPCDTCTSSGASAAWLEAESGALSGNPTFDIVSSSGAAGGAYLSPSGSSTSQPGLNRASYTVDVAGGVYRLWGRVSAPTASSDSFWVKVDGGSFVRWNDILRTSAWAWDLVHNSDQGGSVMTYSLAAGTHTIEIANRESGARLDKLYLTADGDTPSGEGGEGNGGGGGPDPTCSDGVQNQGEADVDCGGPCPMCTPGCSGSACGQPTAPNLLVAFIGDQGNNGNSHDVLELVAAEGADAVVHNGDFDYQDNPAAWDNRVTNVLGSDYPYFAIVGNHDAAAWNGSNGYAAKIAARHARNSEMLCSGELGVRANCTFRGLHMIQSCIGTSELRSSCGVNSSDQLAFIGDSLASSDAIFRVCNWHKNQNDMQVGTKGNEVGWGAYQACMNAGAIVSTGHEHSYARTLTLSDVGNAGAGHGAIGAFDLVSLRSGQNFVFVSGLGGVGIRTFSSSHQSDTWWASYYAGNAWMKNGQPMGGSADYGALFIEFHISGDPTRARGYFKDVNGRIVDDFVIQAE
jgi:hypothetical protein